MNVPPSVAQRNLSVLLPATSPCQNTSSVALQDTAVDNPGLGCYTVVTSMPADSVVGLIESVYAAVGDCGRWQDFICELSASLKSPHASVFYQRADGPSIDFSTVGVVGFEAACLESYRQHYAARNIYLRHGRAKLTPGAVRLDEELCPRAIARHSEFFADWIRPQKIGESALFSTVLQDRVSVALLLVARDGQERYDERDRAQVAQLMPHLQRAFQLHQRFVCLEAGKLAAEEALDQWSVGVIVHDNKGAVLVVNRAARAVLDRKHCLKLDGQRLSATTARQTTLLQDVIRDAIQTTSTLARRRKSDQPAERLRPGGAMMLESSTGERLMVEVSPVGGDTPFVPHGAGAIVFVTDPRAETAGPDEALIALHGFTPREGRVVRELLAGKSLPEIADELGITRNTAKTHATSIYSKTGTRGQADLIRAFTLASSIYRQHS
jgi:DNA-binding CsgD family transcriptional regulator/PAS domain-containing protein